MGWRRSRAAKDQAAAKLAVDVVSFATGVDVGEMLEGPRGSAGAASARQVAMYLCHVAFELSLARVAEAFERDRSTVAHACHIIEDKRDNEGFDAWVASLEAMLREAPAPGQPDLLAS